MDYHNLNKSFTSAFVVSEQIGSLAQPGDQQYYLIWLLEHLAYTLIYPTESVSQAYDALTEDLETYSSFDVDELIELADLLASLDAFSLDTP